jgi:hypothetical protein
MPDRILFIGRKMSVQIKRETRIGTPPALGIIPV